MTDRSERRRNAAYKPYTQIIDVVGTTREQRRELMRQHRRNSPSGRVEVSLWSCRLDDNPTPWRPYRRPMEFRRLCADSHYRLLLRRGEYGAAGPYESLYADLDGIALLDRCVAVETFIGAVKHFPVLVPTDQHDGFLLQQSAQRRGIPCWRFLDGIGFRSTSAATLAKLAMA